MEEEEFLELKQDTLEVFEEDVTMLLEYHEVIRGGAAVGGSVTNDDFGFIDEADTPDNPLIPLTDITELLFSIVHKAKGKRISRADDEFQGDFDVKIFIPTLHIENNNIELRRDSSFFRLPDLSEWRLEAIEPIPRFHGSSIVTKIFCSRRKPQEDNPGAN